MSSKGDRNLDGCARAFRRGDDARPDQRPPHVHVRHTTRVGVHRSLTENTGALWVPRERARDVEHVARADTRRSIGDSRR